MSRGQTPRTSEHFPRMKVRGGARRHRARLTSAARDLARFELEVRRTITTNMAALGHVAKAAATAADDLRQALAVEPRLPWWHRFGRRRG